VLEFTCWNGEVVRLAFALDCHDREAISWVATTAGISGEMIRDIMVQCVEQRFGTIRPSHPVQWLSDNGSVFAAHKTIEAALALNLRTRLSGLTGVNSRPSKLSSADFTHCRDCLQSSVYWLAKSTR
jgi:transposase InsO family protein